KNLSCRCSDCWCLELRCSPRNLPLQLLPQLQRRQSDAKECGSSECVCDSDDCSRIEYEWVKLFNSQTNSDSCARRFVRDNSKQPNPSANSFSNCAKSDG